MSVWKRRRPWDWAQSLTFRQMVSEGTLRSEGPQEPASLQPHASVESRSMPK